MEQKKEENLKRKDMLFMHILEKEDFHKMVIKFLAIIVILQKEVITKFVLTN